MDWVAFGKQSEILGSKMPLSLKKLAYNPCVFPVTTYGATEYVKENLYRLNAVTKIARGDGDQKTASLTIEHIRSEYILVQIKRNKWG